MTKILVVDEHPIMRAGLVRLIEAAPGLEVCGEASESREALRLVATLEPDLVCLEVLSKQASGMDLIRDLIKSRKAMFVLVVSQIDEHIYAQRVVKAGARGFVHKEDSGDHLISAIRTVLRGEVYASQRLASTLMSRSAGGVEDPLEGLSNRELEVFLLLGRGLKPREVAEVLHLSPKTIESYRDRVKHKLGFSSSAALVRHATKLAAGDALAGGERRAPDPHGRAPVPPDQRRAPHYLVSAVFEAPVQLVAGPAQDVGRDEAASIRIASDLVSRRHAEIVWDEDRGFLLSDLDSRNGTLLNGHKLTGSCVLVHGDLIQLGSGFDVLVHVGGLGGGATSSDVTRTLEKPES